MPKQNKTEGKGVKRLCKNCIRGPEKFSSSIMPLSECYKHSWHVHKDGNGYFVFKDGDVWEKEITERLRFNSKAIQPKEKK